MLDAEEVAAVISAAFFGKSSKHMPSMDFILFLILPLTIFRTASFFEGGRSSRYGLKLP